MRGRIVLANRVAILMLKNPFIFEIVIHVLQ